MSAPEEALEAPEPLGLVKDLNYSIFFALKDEDAFVGYNYSPDQDAIMTRILFGLEGEQNSRIPRVGVGTI